MRMPPVAPDDLTAEQRALYDRNRRQMEHGFTAVKTVAADGALLGPWGIFIHEPTVGGPHYDVIAAATALGHLPESAKQMALLAVGAHFRAAYELYAHAATAASAGMDAAKVATVCSGNRPTDLTEDEAHAYDVASSLVAGGVLPGATYAAAVERYGRDGFFELVVWIGIYAGVCLTLNAYDVPSEQFSDT